MVGGWHYYETHIHLGGPKINPHSDRPPRTECTEASSWKSLSVLWPRHTDVLLVANEHEVQWSTHTAINALRMSTDGLNRFDDVKWISVAVPHLCHIVDIERNTFLWMSVILWTSSKHVALGDLEHVGWVLKFISFSSFFFHVRYFVIWVCNFFMCLDCFPSDSDFWHSITDRFSWDTNGCVANGVYDETRLQKGKHSADSMLSVTVCLLS